jgi:hypothetical protein
MSCWVAPRLEQMYSSKSISLTCSSKISAGTADQRGDVALRALSKSESDAAENRDDLLMKLSGETNLNVKFTEEPGWIESDRLAGLQGSVGETFVRKYYQDQVAEHESEISLLQRYIAKPDNEDMQPHRWRGQSLPAAPARISPKPRPCLHKAQERSLRRRLESDNHRVGFRRHRFVFRGPNTCFAR